MVTRLPHINLLKNGRFYFCNISFWAIVMLWQNSCQPFTEAQQQCAGAVDFTVDNFHAATMEIDSYIRLYVHIMEMQRTDILYTNKTSNWIRKMFNMLRSLSPRLVFPCLPLLWLNGNVATKSYLILLRILLESLMWRLYLSTYLFLPPFILCLLLMRLQSIQSHYMLAASYAIRGCLLVDIKIDFNVKKNKVN